MINYATPFLSTNLYVEALYDKKISFWFAEDWFIFHCIFHDSLNLWYYIIIYSIDMKDFIYYIKIYFGMIKRIVTSEATS